MKKDAHYWACVNEAISKAPPVTREQCELLTRVLAPEGWEFIPKEAPALPVAA